LDCVAGQHARIEQMQAVEESRNERIRNLVDRTRELWAEIERLRARNHQLMAWIRRAECHDWMANDDELHRRGLRKLAAEARAIREAAEAAKEER
jgi:hypothetical protein